MQWQRPDMRRSSGCGDAAHLAGLGPDAEVVIKEHEGPEHPLWAGCPLLGGPTGLSLPLLQLDIVRPHGLEPCHHLDP